MAENKSRNKNRMANPAVNSDGNAPKAKYVAKRQAELNNPAVAKQIDCVNYFGLNYSSISGTFLRASQSKSVSLFDNYVNYLLQASLASVRQKKKELAEVLGKFEEQGWSFERDVKPQKVTFNIYRHCINDLMDIVLELDELVTLYNLLEKTPAINTPDMFNGVAQWVKLPDQLNKKLVVLRKRLSDRFKVDTNSRKQSFKDIDFGKVNAMLDQYKNEEGSKIAQLNKKSESDVSTHSHKAKDVSNIGDKELSQESITPIEKQEAEENINGVAALAAEATSVSATTKEVREW